MEIKVLQRAFLPLLILFIVSVLLILVIQKWLLGWHIDPMVLLGGNGVLFLATGASYYLYSKALRNSNPHAFLRALYGSLFVKMIFCLAATFLYVIWARGGVNKPAVFVCFGFYILYTILEVKILMRVSKQQAVDRK